MALNGGGAEFAAETAPDTPQGRPTHFRRFLLGCPDVPSVRRADAAPENRRAAQRAVASVTQMPGCKSDVRDCVWIADLLRYGLLQASFIPDRPQRELRELTRYRMSLVAERS